MTLGQKRKEFTKNLGLLIVWALLNGYELSLGKAFGTTNLPTSVHPLGLAADLNLHINNVYQRTTAAHEPLGQYWKSLHPLNRWGGDFDKPDGNHYSMMHRGYA